MNQNNGLVVFVLIFVALFLVLGAFGGASLTQATILNPPARQEDCACTATSRANTQAALDITATTEIEHLKHTVMPARITAIPYEWTLTAMANTPTPANQPPSSRSVLSASAMVDTVNSILVLGLCVGTPLILSGVVYLIYDFRRIRKCRPE